MQGLEIEAVYEHGTLKLPRELPLLEGATVKITIHPPGRPGVIKHLRIPWTGSRRTGAAGDGSQFLPEES